MGLATQKPWTRSLDVGPLGPVCCPDRSASSGPSYWPSPLHPAERLDPAAASRARRAAPSPSHSPGPRLSRSPSLSRHKAQAEYRGYSNISSANICDAAMLPVTDGSRVRPPEPACRLRSGALLLLRGTASSPTRLRSEQTEVVRRRCTIVEQMLAN